MSSDNLPVGKIAIGAQGLGTVTEEMVEQRALELARIDGRTEANEVDLEAARTELTSAGGEPVAPELDDPELENVTEWDTAPEERGGRVAEVLPDDEANVAQRLVEEGLSEADHSSRRAAAEEFPPDEEDE